MSLRAFATIAVFAASMEMPPGLHRRQARKPAASAAATLSCRRTFFGLASREGQDGLQKTPVVATEYQNVPSAALSRVTMLAQRGSWVMSVESEFMMSRYKWVWTQCLQRHPTARSG